MSTDAPYLTLPLLPDIPAHVSAAQALASELYVGCTNGELLRYALQPEPNVSSSTKHVPIPPHQASYSLLSRQSLPSGKPIDELVLIPYLSRVLILSDHQIHFYTLPSLDPVPNIKPLRNVETFAVDQHHLLRATPAAHETPRKLQPVDFCVIKRNAIALHSLNEDRLHFSREIPFSSGVQLARRAGQYLCVADDQYYNIIDLQGAQMFPVLPVNQATENEIPVKPFIVVVGGNEFLLLSCTGSGTLGVFITGEGDPVRGTLQWPSHPLSICLDYPNITTLLPNGTIEIHNVETQSIVQVIPAPLDSDPVADQRIGLIASPGGYLVPFSGHSEKMRKTSLRFDRK